MSATATPPREAFELQEALASRPAGLDAEGNVLIHVIRPTVGQGRGRHKYSAEMLRENADVFTGWKMYIDHQSPEAKKAAGGLPRSIRDLGGRIIESKWDDSVPASGRFGKGAVVATVKPVGQVKKLIEEDPHLLEASIRAKATDVHESIEDGEQVWVVEGIRSQPPGSVDWVSEGGAGGRVANLIEAMVDEVDSPDEDAEEAEVAEAADEDNDAEGGDSVKQLEEALRDPDSGVSRAVKELVEDRANSLVEEKMTEERERHERELEEAREEARNEASAEAHRQLALRDMKDEAHKLIEEAKLPDKTSTRLKGEYDMDGREPTPKLDRTDTVEDEKVTKTAMASLRESVERDIEEAREHMAEANPTRVEDQGPSDTDGDSPAAETAEKPYWREALEEAGIDPDEAYGNKSTEEKD